MKRCIASKVRLTCVLAGVTIAFAGSVAVAGENGRGAVNHVIDCAQYPADGADRYHDQFLEGCREFAQTMGYRDASLVVMDQVDGVALASEPMTCPPVAPKNSGLYCIGLDKQPR